MMLSIVRVSSTLRMGTRQLTGLRFHPATIKRRLPSETRYQDNHHFLSTNSNINFSEAQIGTAPSHKKGQLKGSQKDLGSDVDAQDDNLKEAVVDKLFQESVQRMKAQQSRSQDEFDWNEGMYVVNKLEEIFPPKKVTSKDLTRVRAARPTATLASLVNESPVLKKLIQLGVNLNKWEKDGHLALVVKLDFERDVKPLVQFIADLGVEHSKIGSVLSGDARLLEVDESHLKTRVAYLLSKRFTKEDIATIMQKCPTWFCHSVQGIDSRLGYFQKTFKLSGPEVRQLAIGSPDLIAWEGTPHLVNKQIFSLVEEMGFSSKDGELKKLLLQDAQLFKENRNLPTVLEQFNLLHNVAEIPHKLLLKYPKALRADFFATRQRYEFLKYLGKAQFNPQLPHYVSLEDLTDTTDEDFCEFVAVCDIKFFYGYLKTI